MSESSQTRSRRNKVTYLKSININSLTLVLLSAKSRDKIDARRFREVDQKVKVMLEEAIKAESLEKTYTKKSSLD